MKGCFPSYLPTQTHARTHIKWMQILCLMCCMIIPVWDLFLTLFGNFAATVWRGGGFDRFPLSGRAADTSPSPLCQTVERKLARKEGSIQTGGGGTTCQIMQHIVENIIWLIYFQFGVFFFKSCSQIKATWIIDKQDQKGESLRR